MEEEILKLQAEVASLKAQLAAKGDVKRERISKLSAEVVDSNPYSRLMALKVCVMRVGPVILSFFKTHFLSPFPFVLYSNIFVENGYRR